ncbi:3530_t:CDS:2 [Paraglomus occultum]|uniref:3530_t:CDS:1 n=1 Tax=Paraglomus occultum TaxID=144539 RepID=A0A9N8ZYT0_9GLOM|nr:3530_t:CDS:2 [Paraglomus occultum]
MYTPYLALLKLCATYLESVCSLRLDRLRTSGFHYPVLLSRSLPSPKLPSDTSASSGRARSGKIKLGGASPRARTVERRESGLYMPCLVGILAALLP